MHFFANERLIVVDASFAKLRNKSRLVCGAEGTSHPIRSALPRETDDMPCCFLDYMAVNHGRWNTRTHGKHQRKAKEDVAVIR